jgi:hypothetical protein
MTKKSDTKTEKKAAAKAKAKAKSPTQTKIPGTERRDRIEEIESAGSKYREARDARMEMQEDEEQAQQDLTNVLRKHGVTSYVYEGHDGKKYEAYIPAEAKAKVRRVKEPKAPKVAE